MVPCDEQCDSVNDRPRDRAPFGASVQIRPNGRCAPRRAYDTKGGGIKQYAMKSLTGK